MAIVGVIIVISSYTLGLYSLVGTTRAQAKMLAESAAAPLMFKDRPAAQELLQSLRTAPDVRLAALYTRDGRLFATLRSDSTIASAADAGGHAGRRIDQRRTHRVESGGAIPGKHRGYPAPERDLGGAAAAARCAGPYHPYSEQRWP